MSKNTFKKYASAVGIIGSTLATLAGSTNALATTPTVYPANLIKGECGTGNLTVHVNGYQAHVACENVNTHTGEAFFYVEKCKDKRHGRKHCHWHRVDIQLPVLKVKKVAYKKDRVITTNASENFHVLVGNNSTYHKNLTLKSKQQRSLIVAAGHYSIHESAHGYNESIRCGHAGSSHDGSITVGVHVGSVVQCTVVNKLIPVHPPKPHKPAPPKHCEVTIHGSLGEARAAYSKHCHQPRKDCDRVYGGWTCSSKMIGHAAPRS